MTDQALQASTYDVLRHRLQQGAEDLRQRFELLNSERTEVFGHLDTRLLATVHVTTEHNCVPRDLLSIGSHLLLGYNVQFGLKNEVVPKDVFSLYRLEGEQAIEEPLSLWVDERFARDFSDLYRYYKQTFFSRFFQQGVYYYMVFQVGKTASDIKAFKWLAEGDRLRYVDNRSEQEIRYPEQHGFRWSRATRDHHRSGTHPHVTIEDIVFVECIGGDLTIKVENNTSSGSGIYSEPVENADQTLDDAEIHYCVLGNLVLLKIRPYQEKEFRFFVYSVKRRQAMRLDAMREACTQLPDDHGIIFPGGVYLQTGGHKLFDHGLIDVIYQRTIAAPNGEDFLYQFFQPDSGSYLQLRYNLIRQEVDTPLVCHGQAIFEDGRMITMRVQEAAQKHHALQLWRTPFVGPNYRIEVATDSMLYKIGNRDLVRCMAECQEVLQLIEKDESYADLYIDLVKRTTDIIDSYFWLDRDETCKLSEPLQVIRQAASAAVDEYEKVVRVRQESARQLTHSQRTVDELIRASERARSDSLETFVELLHQLRTQRGHAIGLRELRLIDLAAVDTLESDLQAAVERVGARCVLFLVQPNSLAPYRLRIQAVAERIGQVGTVAAGREVEKELANIAQSLELLIETISGLKIDDLTQRTSIVDRTSDELAELNKIRAALKSRLRSLLGAELQADFASQSKLLDQATAGSLDAADQPAKVDEALARIMLQIEELESRFAEHDELLTQLHEKRESILAAFEAKRIQLVEQQTRRADGLVSAAQRILKSISTRAERIDSPDELRTYFLSDPMVDKVRQIANQLQALGDSVRQEDVLSKLKTLSDDALRQQRDRLELFADGDKLIRLGQHLFAVNHQPIELTTIVRDDTLMMHLTGTQFFQPLVEADGDGQRSIPPELELARDLWSQSLPGESPEIYRAETLAFDILQRWNRDELVDQWNMASFEQASLPDRIQWLRQWMQNQHSAGYARGVHDHDGALILGELVRMERELGMLRYSPQIRGRTWFVWMYCVPDSQRQSIEAWINSYSAIHHVLGVQSAHRESLSTASASLPVSQLSTIVSQVRQLLSAHMPTAWQKQFSLKSAVHYLVAELIAQVSHGTPTTAHTSQRTFKPQVSATAIKWFTRFHQLSSPTSRELIKQAFQAQTLCPERLWQLAQGLVEQSWQHWHSEAVEIRDDLRRHLDELAALAIAAHLGDVDANQLHSQTVQARTQLSGMLGDHPRIHQGVLQLDYHETVARLSRYIRQVVPRYMSLQTKKRELLHAAENRLRTGEFKARVLTSFVRNRLIDEVFLPRIGENLAKQLGAAGENKRTDRMGLLLLVSPPGYGKTTLVEYIANRLGLAIVKINGPALGHQVRSLDPAEATNAAARQEVKRINLALEMGDNVLLYLDDIQHCHTELLQKFIPLCDATRRIEGVWEGQPKTYDLRGRKVAVVMSGNPYTESGERFQIPDMLANRADVYNLGEIIGGATTAFEQSYLENCLASNPALIPLARASREDQQLLIRAAQSDAEQLPEISANFTSDQLSEMLVVLKKLVKVRDIILRVNRQYIQSAAQADAYRTEPPFKLQGSYRNMNRIAEKVAAVMNDQELMSLVVSAYEQDAQTLTRDGESNMLKFRQLAGLLTPEQQLRWEQICYAYVESIRLGSMAGDDQVVQVLKALAAIRDGLETIRRQIAAVGQQEPTSEASATSDALVGLNTIGQQLVQQLAKTAELMQHQGSQLPEQKVLVQHSVPRSLTDLVRSQYQLLYDGLKHLLEQSSTQTASLDRLRVALADVLNQYGNLQMEIDSAQEPK